MLIDVAAYDCQSSLPEISRLERQSEKLLKHVNYTGPFGAHAIVNLYGENEIEVTTLLC